MNFDTEGVSVQAAAFMRRGQTRQPMRGFNGKGFKDVHVGSEPRMSIVPRPGSPPSPASPPTGRATTCPDLPAGAWQPLEHSSMKDPRAVEAAPGCCPF